MDIQYYRYYYPFSNVESIFAENNLPNDILQNIYQEYTQTIKTKVEEKFGVIVEIVDKKKSIYNELFDSDQGFIESKEIEEFIGDEWPDIMMEAGKKFSP